MLWQEVKQAYPLQWVMIEAIDAISDGNRRIIKQVTVVDTFMDDSKNAYRKYIQLHKLHPERELYIVHTSRPELDIEDQKWVGVRATP